MVIMGRKVTEVYCADCGTTENLIEHHGSYIPEITEVLCVSCHAKQKRRKPKSGRGTVILKTYPQKCLVLFPKYMLKQFKGEFIELYTLSCPVGIIFAYGTPFGQVEKATQIILNAIRFRMELGEE